MTENTQHVSGNDHKPNHSVRLLVIIVTYNEEANLPECLASLKALPAEVFVVDSGSTDRTVEIARAAGAAVMAHTFENYSAQRNWAQANSPITSEWILHIDADERLTPELARSIAQLLETPPSEINGFMMARRTVFLGRWIKHGGHYPVYHLRLYRRGFGRCEQRLYDQHFVVNGPTAILHGDLIDTITNDLGTWATRHVKWAGLEAEEFLRGEDSSQVAPALFGNPIQRRRWVRRRVYDQMPLFLRPTAYFLYRYFVRLGVLDGIEGLIFHGLQGAWFRFMVDAKIFELKQRASMQHAPQTTDLST